MIRLFMVVVGTLLVVATSLVLALGTFWVVELAPLVFFLGAGVAYGVISSQKSPNRPTPSVNILSAREQEKHYE